MSEETLRVTIAGQEREVVIPYNVLVLCCDLFKGMVLEGDTSGGLSFKDQTTVFSYLFGKIDQNGKILEPFNLADFSSAEDAINTLCCAARVADFFTNSPAKLSIMPEPAAEPKKRDVGGPI
jgi:hypothetical protein